MPDVLDRLKTALADRYTIEKEIGRGGMATVYLAEDLKHHRQVAIKVLDPELARALGAERFLREIEVTANLTHPHILGLFDSGEANGFLYYVMPYIEGETLRDRMNREGQLPLDDALQITREVAAALSYAHSHDVIHRDIKPENVLLSAGEAVVADFGIARAVSEAGGEHLTETGISIGTPAYMSPEQASGAHKLDGRSDVYSLGCVLYEMLAGEPPYTGPTAQAVIAKKLSEATPRVSVIRERVPSSVEAAIDQALAKAPADRFTTAQQFADALVSSMIEPRPAERSIAVLPFANMSTDPENEYFSDGLSEDLINALTKVQALRVASRTSAFAFKGKNLDIRKIGKQLTVGTVLEGSVRKAGNRLRVMVQLVNVSDGYHLWSERYDRQMDDVFVIQDEIADNIVKALRVVLSDEEKRAIEKPPTENVEAYEYYLRARQYFHQFRRTAVQFARRMFERAIELDPDYAKAYAGLADCCSFMYMYWDGTKANLEGADMASKKALELDPELAEANASRGFALSLNRQHEEARGHFETAIRLDPKLYEAHYLYARACFQEGRLEDAVHHYEEAARVRPEDYQALLLMEGPLTALERADEGKAATRRGLEVAEKHLELNPDDARALYLAATALVKLGEQDQALELGQRAYIIDPTDTGVLYNVACVYALGGMTHEALDFLDQAIQNGFGHREWLDHDTDLDSLREDPRFQVLLEKCGSQ